MIRDVKSYFQTVASRLSNAFAVEEFDTESELEFWSLAAENISRKEAPKFIDIVQWMDLLYRAPIHFVYKREKEDKLTLYRRQVIVDNIIHVTSGGSGELSKKQQQQVREFEEQLEDLEKSIPWSDEFLNTGISSHSIGKCEHIPIYEDEELWGIYCVGPYVQSPDSIKAKLSIVARILSKSLVEIDSAEAKPTKNYEEKAGEVASDLGTGTLNIDRIANLMLGYLANLNTARFGAIIELTQQAPDFLAKHKLNEEFIAWMKSNIPGDASSGEVEEKLNSAAALSLVPEVDHIKVNELKTEYSRAIIFFGLSEDSGREEEIEANISTTLNDLLLYRRQNLEITNKLIDTYYKMLREMEKKKERTYYHTPRIISLVDSFGQYFGLDKEEQERLVLTARLHDVGYIVTQQLDDRMTVGAELEHPFIGSMIVEALPLHKDVKEGIKTHHEWINGSGTPYGLKGEEIAWTGKIVGLFEFVNEFIENHQDDDSNTEKEWIERLTGELIERAENQFDMVLVPTAIELIQSLGWNEICALGSDK
ncbi:HD domain-containing protein [Aliifodinibius sp. S!AR15-10]|uniref:HD-GYP domain-containing protein n=1 Tax=Aliifodinibius sp. S!AR15-10 TaxID=2950437 RepID=UPI002854F84D|nr:HD domain-containing phosphohydrolase [Aliifodinibius sp. S!AR15-10]MDR8391012.1 HD domain-containing protein [Aliifodinibius sp. S!AR15-10]